MFGQWSVRLLNLWIIFNDFPSSSNSLRFEVKKGSHSVIHAITKHFAYISDFPAIMQRSLELKLALFSKHVKF